MKRKSSKIMHALLLLGIVLATVAALSLPAKPAYALSLDTDLSNASASFWGEDASDCSGYSVTSAGDVNGDGYDDILIGAPYDEDGGDNAGQTYLILGKATGWVMDTHLSNADASFIGEDAWDLSGYQGSVASAGDVNGDGYDDILIGAWGNDDGADIAGQTYLILGKATGWVMDTGLSEADASFIGEGAWDRSGKSVASAGDVNGDGYDDILIGAYWDDDAGRNAGQTYLILGKATGWVMDTHLSNADASFIGEDARDESGDSVASAGDVNGDSYDDILIGARRDEDGGGEYAGQTYLILGKATGWAMDTGLSEADASFIGEGAWDHSGNSVTSAGDVNGDGYDDILIGADGDDDGGDGAGQTYLILGKATGWAMDTDLSNADASFIGEDAEDWSGWPVASAGDVNGDGYDDILIGAHGDEDGGGEYAGQTYLILGKATGWAMDTDLSNADASFIGEDAHDHSGYSVASAGDVNGDGYDDILIGAPHDDDGGGSAGQTYLILGDYAPPSDTISPETEIISGPSGTIDYNDVAFTWTGADDVTPPCELVYSYYLEGRESEWSGWTSKTSKQYANLPNGDYTFRVKAKDQAGNIDPTPAERSFTVFVNQLPIASFTYSPESPGENQEIVFDASSSYDPDGEIISYKWDLDNDGQYDDATGVTTTVIFDDDGSFTVGLRVTDEYDESDTAAATITVNNVAPTASATNDGPKDEGTPVTFTASQTDPGADTFTYSFDWNNDGTYDIEDQANPSAQHTFMDEGTYAVGVRVKDDDGGIGITTTHSIIDDLGPTAGFTWSPEPADEGTVVQFTDTSTSYPDEIASWTWDFGDDGTSSEPDPTHTYGDNGIYTVTLTVTDDDGSTDATSHDVTIDNVAPTVGPITSPIDPVQVGTEITASAPFTDPGTADTHTAEWNWGDDTTSTGTVTESDGSGSVTGSHTYTTPGIYTITLTVTDDDGGIGTVQSSQYVVVYDPDGGFVTGGGWIDSPEGAYTPEPSLTGKANFGFVSKYKKGATVPTGQTEFQFKVADLNFHSSSYDWLVIAGHKAMYKGTGTINGAGNYRFMLSAIDEELTPSTDVDMFRIKIWEKDNGDAIVYDNQMGDADDADLTTETEIQGGSIKIHSGK